MAKARSASLSQFCSTKIFPGGQSACSHPLRWRRRQSTWDGNTGDNEFIVDAPRLFLVKSTVFLCNKHFPCFCPCSVPLMLNFIACYRKFSSLSSRSSPASWCSALSSTPHAHSGPRQAAVLLTILPRLGESGDTEIHFVSSWNRGIL